MRAEVKAATEECRAKRLRGELRSYVESARCANQAFLAIAAKANLPAPNMDLVNLLLAARLAGAEKIDKGEIAEAQMQLDLAELNVQVDERGAAPCPRDDCSSQSVYGNRSRPCPGARSSERCEHGRVRKPLAGPCRVSVR